MTQGTHHRWAPSSNGTLPAVLVVQIALFYGTGAKSSVFHGPAINILGALFTTLVNCSMTPFNSITMFIFDRHFLLRESADGLYSIR
jgi:hypothetical protein